MIKILAEHVAELNISFGVLEESEGPSGAKMRGKRPLRYLQEPGL